MNRTVVLAGLVACGSAPVAPPQPPPPPPVSIDAPSPDAGVSEAVANAPAWIFRFNAPGRLETWTLRYSGDAGMVTVETAQGTTRYLGTVTDGASLRLAMTAGAARLSLDCKHDKLAASSKCGDTKAPKLDVLNCYHPDFKAPMPFGPSPGVEYVTSATCNGYRLLP